MDFDWKALGAQVAKLGLPLLGGALGGPGGAAVGQLIASALNLDLDPKAISEAIVDPKEIGERLTALRQVELQHQSFLVKAAYDHEVALRQSDSSDLTQVNETMRSESKSEHWPQWSWRPYNGFLFGTTMFGCYFLLPLLSKEVPSVPFEAWAAWGAILGVASWWRGRGKAAA